MYNFAKTKGVFETLKGISLGQGQGVVALELIRKAKIEGNWVLLQNCHLAKSFMPELEAMLEEIAEKAEEFHESFRLFLTSMPTVYFPVSILQNGIKLTTEPPRGLKANLKRSLQNLTEEQLAACDKKETFHKLTLGLCFFHALVQERRKFGPLGWNIRYEFNDSDLETSRTVLEMLLNEQASTPWDALTFVVGHINYGGRVTDDWDQAILEATYDTFFHPGVIQKGFEYVAGLPDLHSGRANSIFEQTESI